MTWNPLRTLAGRLVLVTVVAVAISYAAAFAWFSNERGAALRRVAETSVSERISYTAERLRNMPAERRASVASQIRDYSIRYSVTPAPDLGPGVPTGASGRIARLISEALDNTEVRAVARTLDVPSRRWRIRGDGEDRRGRRSRHGDDNAQFDHRAGGGDEIAQPPPDAPLVSVTHVSLSVKLANDAWLNATARLPGPRPPPFNVLIGALISVIAVGIGAALVSRQIGRPLADLANAARALGSGQTNVTAPVSGPEDVRNASTAFNAMAERLGRQLNRQRQMLWALSHDLRTPITAIRLRAELVEDEATRQRLLDSVTEMEQLTEQALALARAGASEEARVKVDLAEIARTLCGELQDMGLSISAEANEPLLVECRPSEIARALRNLAENAAKYGGGGVMRVYRGDKDEAIAEVRDEGPGVPPDLIGRVTAPFFRADEARSNESGAGLGLAIVQAIADGHGGRLALENIKPRGFSAKLILPG
ncbi:ATP-binding protein [Terricaulis sp.]|uniref:ATP-binding protein n=1 Tax=Terricaulis sp. TaxID=2768686 RepID=UPI00378524FE